MATRDPEAKRQQLLDAALIEFAAHGISGARMDQVAKRAGCSAGLAYSYFKGKDELFDAVYEQIVRQTVSTVPIDPEDLPGYAARLYDANQANPEVVRLITWYRLERGEAALATPLAVQSTRSKIDAVRAAQVAGTVSDRFPAETLVALIQHIAMLWSVNEPRGRMRDTVAESVRRLVEP
ncbi:TetR family transcriptional regulator [Kutzneria sp. CA-103260]|uniref:TetR family transcriptional regulator n=1 Tax=Kutzneria sp. CA-103260 TaxID=2802641 RepID=UPI001BAAEE5E|nr:TetR family transcriptional regulator [Kutzneria sp. CA-103260]QUQ72265.1 tetR family regulatory protein [Kutzneria sp. CA-103260]